MPLYIVSFASNHLHPQGHVTGIVLVDLLTYVTGIVLVDLLTYPRPKPTCAGAYVGANESANQEDNHSAKAPPDDLEW